MIKLRSYFKNTLNGYLGEKKIVKLGMTPLMVALSNQESIETIKELISSEQHINVACHHDKTALIYAIEYGYGKDIVSEITSKGADVNYRSEGNNGFTPLFFAMAGHRDPEIVQFLISNGADLYAHNSYDCNIFVFICCNNSCSENYCFSKELFKVLLDSGINLKTRDSRGNNIIHYVNTEYVIRLAIKKGVSIESKNNAGDTPLMDATHYTYSSKVATLLKFNADPNCMDSDLNMPLHYHHNSSEVNNLLLYHGADLFSRDADGKTPLDVFDSITEIYFKRHKEGIKAIVKHVLLFIDDSMLNMYTMCHDSLESFPGNQNSVRKYLHWFVDECKAEVHRMKNMLLQDNLTFYNFCSLKRFHHNNKSVFTSLKGYKYKNYSDIKLLFPIYEDLIIMRMIDHHRERFKQILINQLENIILRPITFSNSNSDEIHLPYDCLYLVVGYLVNKEICNLVWASFGC